MKSEIMEALSQQMGIMFSRFEASQPGQQQRQSTAAPAQAMGPRQQTSRPEETFYNQQQPFYCYECGAPGHIARNCEMRDNVPRRKFRLNRLTRAGLITNDPVLLQPTIATLDLEEGHI